MKKKILYFIFSIVFVYLILNIVIGNDNFKTIKDTIPNYFQWKNFVKNIFFSHKNKKILIKTDGLESFNLQKDNKIFIYSNFKKSSKLLIKGVLKNENIVCLDKNFTESFIINLHDLNSKCSEAIYFIGEIDEDFFYFGLQKSEKKTKNLLVLPTTNFYDYSSNKLGFNQHSSNIDYIAKLDEIPHYHSIRWALKTSQSIHNINKIINDFTIILDYKLEKTSLENYDLIILPLHQEKVSKKFLEKLLIFLSRDNKKVLSIGGTNFMRETIFKKNLIIYNKDKYIDVDKFNLNPWDNEKNKNCYFIDNSQLELGEITDPIIKNSTKYYFYKILCDNKKKLPLLSITNFKNNGKLLHLMSDGIGINFTKIEYLKSKILKELLIDYK